MEGRIFMDRFLIADVVMKADLPAERWFLVRSAVHPNQSVLLHKQADNVWRIDFSSAGTPIPKEKEARARHPAHPRAMLGDEREFELDGCRLHLPVPAHAEIPPRPGAVRRRCRTPGCRRSARGANSGLQDTDNLVWKLKLVMDGLAPDTLLDTYSDEPRRPTRTSSIPRARPTSSRRRAA